MNTDSFVTSLRIGDVTASAINEGTALWDPHLTAPAPEWREEMQEADEVGRIPINFFSFILQTTEAAVLIDPGFDDPEDLGTPATTPEWPQINRTPGLRAGLEALGLRPDDITHVVLTHTHVDHFRGVTIRPAARPTPRFQRARVFVSQRDWEEDPERLNQESDISVRLGAIDALGMLQPVHEDTTISPGVAMVSAPGESPGHSVVRVTSRGRTLYILGDLIHHICEISHPHWRTPWSDEAALLTSRRKIFTDAVERNAIITFTHAAFPPWFTIGPSAAGFSAQALR